MWKYAAIIIATFVMLQTNAKTSGSLPRVFSVSIPGLINGDGSGFYLQLMQQTLGIKQQDIELLPTKRALKMFTNASHSTCMFPLSRKTAINLGINTQGKIFSQPFNTSYATLISSRSTQPVVSLQELKTKIVGVVLGFPIADNVVAAAKYVVKPNSIDSLLKMLELGRVDYAYVHYPDVLIQYARSGISRYPESQLKFHFVPEALACTLDESGIVSRFNEAIDSMYEDGSIKNVLSSAYTGRD